MLDELLKASGGKLLIPILVVLMGTALVKGGFGLYRSRSSNRRDFLELWPHAKERDDLWLEVSIRHIFGAYLASLIRRLMQKSSAGQVLLAVGASWELFDVDKSHMVRWKAKRHASAMWRGWEIYTYLALYFLFSASALYLGYQAVFGTWSDIVDRLLWIYAVIFAAIGLTGLAKSETLKSAQEAATRWLDLS